MGKRYVLSEYVELAMGQAVYDKLEDGTFTGARHQFLVYQEHRLAIPSNEEYSVPQLRMMLREAGGILRREIALEEWERF